MHTALSRRPQLRPKLSTVMVVLVGLALTLLLSFGFQLLVRMGPPPGKTETFFTELALLFGVMVVGIVVLAFEPEKVRVAIPFFFIVLGWHTGFQLSVGPDGSLSSSDGSVLVSVFDVIVPILVVVALLAGWHRGTSISDALAGLRRPFVVFAIFCFWGIVVAIARGVPFPPFVANLKALTIYPLIALLIPWCLTTRRQLYLATGLLLGVIFLRVYDGLRGAGVSGIAHITYLANGQAADRITGAMTSTNQYAFYIMSGTLITLALIVGGRSMRLRAWLAGPLALAVLALLLTLSRGAWLGLGAGLIALALLLQLRRSAFLPGAVLLILPVVNFLHPGASTLVAGRLNSQAAVYSTQERQDYLTLGVDVIQHYPEGAGWGASFFETPMGLVPGKTAVDWPWYHNDYIQLASEIGILGLVAFCWIWLAIFRGGIRAYRRSRRTTHGALMAGMIAALVGMLVQATTDQFFWHSDLGPHLWIVAGLLLTAIKSAEPRMPAEAHAG